MTDPTNPIPAPSKRICTLAIQESERVFELLHLDNHKLTVFFPTKPEEIDGERTIAHVKPSPAGADLTLFPDYMALDGYARIAVLSHEAFHLLLRPIDRWIRLMVERHGSDRQAAEFALEDSVSALELSLAPVIYAAYVQKFGFPPSRLTEGR